MITKKFVNQLAVAATGVTLSLGILDAKSAQAIGFNFAWEGNGGYSAQGMFSYDENTAPPIFSESGPGPTNALDSLMVSFFDPGGGLLGTFNNVVNGVSDYSFLTFTFDTVNEELIDFFDVGADSVPGDFYLAGDPQSDSLTLFNASLGPVDFGGPVTVSQKVVPEPTSLFGLMSICLLGVGSALKRKQENKV